MQDIKKLKGTFKTNKTIKQLNKIIDNGWHSNPEFRKLRKVEFVTFD